MNWHESPYDRANEKEVAAVAEKRLNVVLRKIPSLTYGVDWIIYKNGKARGFAECKARTYTSTTLDRLGGFDIAYHKICAGRRLCEPMGFPFLLFLKLPDGYFWTKISKFEGLRKLAIVEGGREDRNEPGAIEPMMRFPMKYFKRLQP